MFFSPSLTNSAADSDLQVPRRIYHEGCCQFKLFLSFKLSVASDDSDPTRFNLRGSSALLKSRAMGRQCATVRRYTVALTMLAPF